MHTDQNKKRIAILVSCTKRKTVPESSGMRFRSLERKTVELLADEWTERARRVATQLRVDSLYCGPAWKLALSAADASRDRLGKTSLYVMSAGFGLLRTIDVIPSYSATFADEEDQIAKRIQHDGTARDAHRRWWRAINEVRQTQSSAAYEELAAHDYILVAAGMDYMNAAMDDLTKLAIRVGPERLFLINVGINAFVLDPVVQLCLVPVDITVEHMLKGARSTVNQRILHWLVRDILPSENWNREQITTVILDQLEAVKRQVRLTQQRVLCRQTDEQVLAWLRQRFTEQPDATKSSLLREFRKAASCEQSRFYKLIDLVRKENESVPLWE